jgi:head-tail adaptor
MLVNSGALTEKIAILKRQETQNELGERNAYYEVTQASARIRPLKPFSLQIKESEHFFVSYELTMKGNILSPNDRVEWQERTFTVKQVFYDKKTNVLKAVLVEEVVENEDLD